MTLTYRPLTDIRVQKCFDTPLSLLPEYAHDDCDASQVARFSVRTRFELKSILVSIPTSCCVALSVPSTIPRAYAGEAFAARASVSHVSFSTITTQSASTACTTARTASACADAAAASPFAYGDAATSFTPSNNHFAFQVANVKVVALGDARRSLATIGAA
jgi:hypothetical protein